MNARKIATAIAGAAAAALLTATPAHADTSTFLQELHRYGWDANQDAAYAKNGRLVCALMADSGMTPKQIARQLYLRTSVESEGDAQEFVAIAFVNLCPRALSS